MMMAGRGSSQLVPAHAVSQVAHVPLPPGPTRAAHSNSSQQSQNIHTYIYTVASSTPTHSHPPTHPHAPRHMHMQCPLAHRHRTLHAGRSTVPGSCCQSSPAGRPDRSLLHLAQSRTCRCHRCTCPHSPSQSSPPSRHRSVRHP